MNDVRRGFAPALDLDAEGKLTVKIIPSYYQSTDVRNSFLGELINRRDGIGEAWEYQAKTFKLRPISADSVTASTFREMCAELDAMSEVNNFLLKEFRWRDGEHSVLLQVYVNSEIKRSKEELLVFLKEHPMLTWSFAMVFKERTTR